MESMSPNQLNAFDSSGERHTIETPEQTRLEFPVAGVGSRFLALLIDTLIQAALGVVAALALAFTLPLLKLAPFGPAGAEAALWATAAAMVFFFVLQFCYFAGFEIVWGGQTPGKRAVGIRVLKETGRPLTPAEAIARNLMRIVDQLPAFYAIGILTALLNRQNKRLGDFVAGSIVVREGALAEMRPTWAWSAPPAAAQGALGADRLSAEDLSLIDAFLSRRYELPPDVRWRTAAQILGRLAPKLPAPPDPAVSPEAILEALAYARRSSGGFA
jgi:uncharacterized RDD family membrane protein YckC